MAELNLGKGLTAGKVASNVQKKLTRAQEKVRRGRPLANGRWAACEAIARATDRPRARAALLPHRPGAVSHHDLQ